MATIVIAVLARRWRPGNVRLRLVSTAVIATASGLGMLMAIATVVLAVQ